jgi:glycogen(starch) synthase
MRTIDAVVMPSVWEETAGLSAIEQMMRGRLVVAADIGGLGEVVGEGGLKFPPGDIEGLASCLRRVLDEPDLAKALGKKARQRALQLFLEERMVAEHLSVYRQLLGGSGPSPEGPGAVGLPLGSSER